MKIFILIICLTLMGCVPPLPPTRSDVIMIGDSNCDADYYHQVSWQIAGIAGDCLAGRKLIDIDYLYSDKTLVFLALGVNDASHDIPPSEYGLHLTALLSTTNADVYCILPILKQNYHIPDFSVNAYRNEMINRCTNILDPLAVGVIVTGYDGLHLTDLDQHVLAAKLKQISNLYEVQ